MQPTRLILCAALALALTQCKTITSERVVFPDVPVTYQTVSDMVDEETIEHSLKFRNIGQQILSFDYTVSDGPGVPHMDCLGPNSGLVENLYPGAEAQVKNPIKSSKVFITLGRVTYGKRTSEQLAKQYKPSTLPAPGSSGAGSLPTLESMNIPGQ